MVGCAQPQVNAAGTLLVSSFEFHV